MRGRHYFIPEYEFETQYSGNQPALFGRVSEQKKPKDSTIREKFNTYRLADHKEKVIDLLLPVTTVSVGTVEITKAIGEHFAVGGRLDLTPRYPVGYCGLVIQTRRKLTALRILNETFVPDERKAELRKRLKRLQGQVAGVGRMLDDDRACMEILTQVSAAHEALRGFSRVMVLNYLERCATVALKEGRQGDVYEDLMKVIFKLAR